MSKDIVLERDTPFFATSDAPLVLINNGSIDRVNTEMMNVRWRMFPLHRQIPRDEQRNIASCARCFADLILYAEHVVNFERNQFDSMKFRLSSTIPTIYSTLKCDIIICK